MKAFQRAVLIYNPRAGRFVRGGDRILRRVQDALAGAGQHVVFRPTTGPQTASAIARESVRDGADLVIAAGGDGTINEVVEGLAGSHVPLGVLPAGTANVLAVETGIGVSLRRAARLLPECVPVRIPLGRITLNDGTSRYFLLMAGAGLDALIVYQIDPALKSKAGKLAYWMGGLRMLGREFPEFLVDVNGRSYTCSFALISKVRNYGGDFQIASQTSLLDDRFEVVLFSGSKAYLYIKYLAGVAARRVHEIKGVTVLRTTAVDLRCPSDQRIYIQIDGEFAGRLPARVELAPDALTLLLPPSYLAARQRVA